MKFDKDGREVYERKPLALGVKGLQRPMTPREEMMRMIVEYDAQRRRARTSPAELNDDDLVRDDGDETPLTDAEMEYQLSVAEAQARLREAREDALNKRKKKDEPPKPQNPPSSTPAAPVAAEKKEDGPPTK